MRAIIQKLGEEFRPDRNRFKVVNFRGSGKKASATVTIVGNRGEKLHTLELAIKAHADGHYSGNIQLPGGLRLPFSLHLKDGSEGPKEGLLPHAVGYIRKNRFLIEHSAPIPHESPEVGMNEYDNHPYNENNPKLKRPVYGVSTSFLPDVDSHLKTEGMERHLADALKQLLVGHVQIAYVMMDRLREQ